MASISMASTDDDVSTLSQTSLSSRQSWNCGGTSADSSSSAASFVCFAKRQYQGLRSSGGTPSPANGSSWSTSSYSSPSSYFTLSWTAPLMIFWSTTRPLYQTLSPAQNTSIQWPTRASRVGGETASGCNSTWFAKAFSPAPAPSPPNSVVQRIRSSPPQFPTVMSATQSSAEGHASGARYLQTSSSSRLTVTPTRRPVVKRALYSAAGLPWMSRKQLSAAGSQPITTARSSDSTRGREQRSQPDGCHRGSTTCVGL
mmetsp:Transcript_7488/g.19658  ORF Transcript_7488/g.19658 Transcript_7488/m.19658 type:complete len:257 (+) Transcript_7488:293-1063(+)